jgi:hypothetical protein
MAQSTRRHVFVCSAAVPGGQRWPAATRRFWWQRSLWRTFCRQGRRRYEQMLRLWGWGSLRRQAWRRSLQARPLAASHAGLPQNSM